MARNTFATREARARAFVRKLVPNLVLARMMGAALMPLSAGSMGRRLGFASRSALAHASQKAFEPAAAWIAPCKTAVLGRTNRPQCVVV